MRELNKPACLVVASRHRFLAVDVLPGLEGSRRHLGVHSMGGEVDDGIDRGIGPGGASLDQGSLLHPGLVPRGFFLCE